MNVNVDVNHILEEIPVDAIVKSQCVEDTNENVNEATCVSCLAISIIYILVEEK